MVDLGHHAAELKAFWPTGGPHWDALAVVRMPESAKPGFILAEGKSYPGELYGSGCQAKPKSVSRVLIEKSLAATQQRLGVTGKTPQDWSGPLYQTAKRLAHLQWLRSLGVRAWLVHLLFLADPIGPTDPATWTKALADANVQLGLDGIASWSTARATSSCPPERARSCLTGRRCTGASRRPLSARP